MWQRWHHAARSAGRLSAVSVPVCDGEHHAGCPDGRENVVGADDEADDPAGTIAPGSGILAPPSAIAKTEHRPTVRAPAALALTLGPAEPDHRRQLAPVDRIEEPMLAPDRHDGNREIGRAHV